jgi:hypothetical protein
LECGTTAQDLDVHLVADLTDEHRLGGRVTVGHMAKLSLLPVAEMAKVAQRMADVGVAVTVLPATDLFLMGKAAVATKLRCLGLCKVEMSLGGLVGSVSRRRGDHHIGAAPASSCPRWLPNWLETMSL